MTFQKKPALVLDEEINTTEYATTTRDQCSTETSAEDQQLDADEIALRALRIDLPGVADAPTGIVSITVSGKFPKHEFFRVHPANTVTIFAVTHEAGMDTDFYAVKPEMVPALAAIGIDAMHHRLYELITADGAIRLVWFGKPISTVRRTNGIARKRPSSGARGMYGCGLSPISRTDVGGFRGTTHPLR